MSFLASGLLLAAAAIGVSAQFDCEKLICNPCNEKVPVDFIFIVDASPSMQGAIDQVKSGLQTFAREVAQSDVNARYWTILTGSTVSSGRRTELVIGGDDGLNSTAPLISGFGRIRATYAVSGFQEARGGQESAFEAIRMSLGEAKYNIFDHKNIGGSGKLNLRPDARKFIMLLTDEDSDAPLYPGNFEWGFSSSDYSPTGWPSYTSGKWAEELKATTKALIDTDTTIYMFVDPGQGVSRKQFGDPKCDISNADFSNFDRQATIDCLANNALSLSLVGGVLSQGKTARVFNVLDIAKPGFVNNFFTDAVRTVAKCETRKRQVDQNCVAYRCSPTIGCYVDYLCAAGCDQCKIGSKCYRAFDQNPAKSSSCEFCIPSKSKTSWSQCSGTVGTCQQYGCLPSFGYCSIEDVCTPACQRCKIGNACVKANAANPNDICLKCVPATNATDWSNTCPKCTPECKNGGVCSGTGSVRTCDCENTNFLGAACDEPPTCTKPCQNGGLCVVDNASLGTTKCQCDVTGFAGDDCSVCDPMVRVCNEETTATVACDSKCAAACPSGVATCVCDAAGTPTFECMQTSECTAKCNAQCSSGVATMCKCDPMSDKIEFQCQQGVETNGASAIVSSATVVIAYYAWIAMMQ